MMKRHGTNQDPTYPRPPAPPNPPPLYVALHTIQPKEAMSDDLPPLPGADALPFIGNARMNCWFAESVRSYGEACAQAARERERALFADILEALNRPTHEAQSGTSIILNGGKP